MITLNEYQLGHLLTEMLHMHTVLGTDDMSHPSKSLEIYRLGALYVSDSQWHHQVMERVIRHMHYSLYATKWIMTRQYSSLLANNYFTGYNEYTQKLIWSKLQLACRRTDGRISGNPISSVRLYKSRGQAQRAVDRNCLLLLALTAEDRDRVQCLIDLVKDVELGYRGKPMYLDKDVASI